MYLDYGEAHDLVVSQSERAIERFNMVNRRAFGEGNREAIVELAEGMRCLTHVLRGIHWVNYHNATSASLDRGRRERRLRQNIYHRPPNM